MACHFGSGEPLIDFGRDCTADADCADFEPPFDFFYSRACNEAFCSAGRCTTRPRQGRITDERSGDCLRPVCRNGARMMVADDSDTPTTSPECTEAVCSGGWSTYRSLPDGTKCTRGECRAGACFAFAPDAAADAGLDAGDDAADAAAD